MFTLQKLNVVRIVETEREKAKLIAEGFKEVVEQEVEKVKEVIINKKLKGKE